MNHPTVLAVVVSNGNIKTPLDCLLHQTRRPDKIVLAIQSFSQCSFVGERVGLAINHVIERLDLTQYTHIFRLDDDVKISPLHLEIALDQNADLVGTGGYAMLIKTEAFQKLFSSYPVHPCEDSLIAHKFLKAGYKVCRSPCEVEFYGKKSYPSELFFQIGVFRQQANFNLLSVLCSFRDKNGGNLVGLNVVHIWAGYLYAHTCRFLHRKP